MILLLITPFTNIEADVSSHEDSMPSIIAIFDNINCLSRIKFYGKNSIIVCITKQIPFMKAIFNILILIAVIGLAYLLFNGIKEPIAFKSELDRRESIVVDRLSNIKTCQEMSL